MKRMLRCSAVLLALSGAFLGCPPQPPTPTSPAITTFSINNGASVTASRTVTLNNVCSGSPTYYRASESATFSDNVWLPYSTGPTLTLSSGNGAKTVYFVVQNTAGLSTIKTDTIELREPLKVDSFAVNLEAPSATSRNIKLNSRCTGTATHFMASESASFTGASWQGYTPTADFVLSSGDGIKTVYFKVKDSSGETTAKADTITLTEMRVPTVSILSINNGEATTHQRVVALNNGCTDLPTQCMLSESSSFSGANWQDYSVAPKLSLSGSEGVKTVYFKVKSALGESAVKSDTISLALDHSGYYALDWRLGNLRLLEPGAIATDQAGNIYVVDTGAPRVQKLSPDGTVLSAWGGAGSGNGQFGTSGDFLITNPNGIAVDGAGNVYVVDSLNNRVQKFTSGGVFVTAWGGQGTGQGQFDSPFGIAADSAGNVYVTDSGNGRIEKFTSNGVFVSAWGGAGAGNGQLSAPRGIAVSKTDSVYVADAGNKRIQRFSTSGTFQAAWHTSDQDNGTPQYLAVNDEGDVYVSELCFYGDYFYSVKRYSSAGTLKDQTGGLSYVLGQGPVGVAVGSQGTVYVSTPYGGPNAGAALRKYSPDCTFQSAWSDSATCVGEMYLPCAVAVDFLGSIYVANFGGIQKLSAGGASVEVWGKVDTDDEQDYQAGAMAVDFAGNTYVLDVWGYRVLKFSSQGQLLATIGDEESLSEPRKIALDAAGNIYVTDNQLNTIVKFAWDGTWLGNWSGSGTGNGQYWAPDAITVDEADNVYVLALATNQVRKFASSGVFLTAWGGIGEGNGRFRQPTAMVANSDGVYVADNYDSRVQKFSTNGAFLAAWGNTGTIEDPYVSSPSDMATDRQGSIYVACASDGNSCVQKYSADGTIRAIWGGWWKNDAGFRGPTGVATDGAGHVYVSDMVNNRIQKFSKDGTFISAWGKGGSSDGQFEYPSGVEVDGAGNVYVTEFKGERIQKFTPDGTHLATWEDLVVRPTDIAVSKSGEVYVTDGHDDRILKLSASGAFLKEWGGEGADAGRFRYPTGVALDSGGNVYVADSGNRRIQVFTSDGTFLRGWGSEGTSNGQFGGLGGIGIDSADNVYVTDPENRRIQKFTSQGVFLTSWGGEGPADGWFSDPKGIAIDGDSNVFVADSDSNLVQKFVPSD